MSRKYVMQEKRYYSGVSIPYILPSERAINIDDHIDLLVAERKLKNLK